MAQRPTPNYDASAAYSAMAGQQGAPTAGGEPDADDQSGGQPLTIPPDVVAQLIQLKQGGDMAALGQAIASLLP